MRIRPVIILFTGHCGSSWFVDLLGRQPWCVRLGFEPIDETLRREPHFPLDHFLRELFALHPNAMSHRLIRGGAFTPQSPFNETTTHLCLKTRILPEQPVIFGNVLPQSNACFLHMRRRNKIAAAVSNYKRAKLGISHINRDMPIIEKRRPIRVDVRYVAKKARQFLMREAIIEYYKKRISRFIPTVWYEDLLNDSTSTLAAIGAHIGADIGIAESSFDKMTSPNLADSVTNYDELKLHLRRKNLLELLENQTAESQFVQHILAGSNNYFGLWMQYCYRMATKRIDEMFVRND